ncbi:MAG: hypothetical protein LBN93_01185 [Candidatus Symbiothrix sp.]|nr:hypothetical protein [Candidatus Symbiothrix sp.]
MEEDISLRAGSLKRRYQEFRRILAEASSKKDEIFAKKICVTEKSSIFAPSKFGNGFWGGQKFFEFYFWFLDGRVFLETMQHSGIGNKR